MPNLAVCIGSQLPCEIAKAKSKKLLAKQSFEKPGSSTVHFTSGIAERRKTISHTLLHAMLFEGVICRSISSRQMMHMRWREVTEDKSPNLLQEIGAFDYSCEMNNQSLHSADISANGGVPG